MAHDLQHLKADTLADQAYAAIREAIMAGTLKNGERLTERGLASSFAVSPTPIREAVRRLEQDLLIERLGPKTVCVAAPSQEKREEIGLIESTLKATAARIAATKITDEELDQLQHELDAADQQRKILNDLVAARAAASEITETARALLNHTQRFHHAVTQASRNNFLMHMLRTAEPFGMRERQDALRIGIERGRSGQSERYMQHREILDALRNRDPNETERLVLKHSRAANEDIRTTVC